MQLFDVGSYEIEAVLGPRVDRETGDWTMDLYFRYKGSRDMDLTWNAKIDYGEYDMSFEDMQDEYSVWRDTFENELPDAELYFSEF